MIPSRAAHPPKSDRIFSMLLPWLFGILSVFAFSSLILLTKIDPTEKPETLVVRPLEVNLTPPPEPPPPEKPTQQMSDAPPTINFSGPGNGPPLTFSEQSRPAMNNLAKIEKPEFDRGNFDLAANLNVTFPILKVQELDSVPRLVSTNRISFPRSLRERGVNRVATKVEIIIDQQGRAYGKSVRTFDAYRDGCGENLEAGALNSYIDGYTRGIVEFCTYEHGYEYAAQNLSMPDVCPTELKSAFEKGYAVGKFELREKLSELNRKQEDQVRQQEAKVNAADPSQAR